MYGAVKFVGPGSIAEQPAECCIYLFFCRFPADAGERHKSIAKFRFSAAQVFRDIKENLSPGMGRSGGPASRFGGRFNRVADILAITVAHITCELSKFVKHWARIAAIGTYLLAADKVFGSLVYIGAGHHVI